MEKLKLYTSSEKIAEIWKKQFPGVEIVITPKSIPTNLTNKEKI